MGSLASLAFCLVLGLVYTYPGGLLASLLLARPLLSFLLLSPL